MSLTGKAKGGRKSVRTQKWPVPGHSDNTDLGGRLRESLEFNLEARGGSQRSYVVSLSFPCVLPSRLL